MTLEASKLGRHSDSILECQKFDLKKCVIRLTSCKHCYDNDPQAEFQTEFQAEIPSSEFRASAR